MFGFLKPEGGNLAFPSRMGMVFLAFSQGASRSVHMCKQGLPCFTSLANVCALL